MYSHFHQDKSLFQQRVRMAITVGGLFLGQFDVRAVFRRRSVVRLVPKLDSRNPRRSRVHTALPAGCQSAEVGLGGTPIAQAVREVLVGKRVAADVNIDTKLVPFPLASRLFVPAIDVEVHVAHLVRITL